ncbi:MAG: ATP-dependent DNA helicase RecG [Candidatus Izemoplasmatales bacterium]
MIDLKEIKGIGPSSLEKLSARGIFSSTDLIHTFPIRYDIHHISKYENVRMSEEITLLGTLLSKPSLAYIRRRLTKMTCLFDIEGHPITVTIFNREFLMKAMIVGEDWVLTGKFQSQDKMVVSDLNKRIHFQEGMIPRYGIDGISDKSISKWIASVLTPHMVIPETIPLNLASKHHLPPAKDFFRGVHQPTSQEELDGVIDRIKYEELLSFFTRLAWVKSQKESIRVRKKEYDIHLVKDLIASLPFELTQDQKEVTNEIFRDLKKERQMNRLLQGDTGSGKTICAMIAAYAVVTAHEQVAFMAPTEVLAFQQYQSFQKVFEGRQIRVRYLSSSVSSKERFEILRDLQKGHIDILVGTHSLIQEDVSFHQLGFVIIDEQHRFGVEQRGMLRKKGYAPDVLFMSATPIPRTLAITMFSDMDLSSIRTMPEGRKKIQTEIRSFESMDDVWERFKQEIRQGHQGYVITPLIEESQSSSSISTKEALELVTSKLPPTVRVGELHGKMKNNQKTSVLEDFQRAKIDVLVSTTVVEVGVNVPNATVMIIFNASRFGLSQLHQIRGRVGRSHAPSVCYLMTDGMLDEESRLHILTTSADGFDIAEADLSDRGPGQIFGNEQTGIPKFRMADFAKDTEWIQFAMEDSALLLTSQEVSAKDYIQSRKKLMDTVHLD